MKEYEIRPKEIFDEYLTISKADIPLFFGDSEHFERVVCPACGEAGQVGEFVKHGFEYVSCLACGTLYVSPRPTAEMINRFYRESDSSRYWAEKFFPLTAAARMEAIFRPRAKMISDLVERFGAPRPRVLADVGAGIGLFLDAAKETDAFDEVVGIEPGQDLAKVCRQRGHRVIEAPVEEVSGDDVRASVVTSFEVFEHLSDPKAFLESKARLLMPGGLLIFTTLTVSGFDLQVLWDQSKSISPPHHINFASVQGFGDLVRRCGLDLVDVSTPGKLDLDIVRNMLIEDENLSVPRFVRTMLRETAAADVNLGEDFQRFLQAHRLSSHACVVARKPA